MAQRNLKRAHCGSPSSLKSKKTQNNNSKSKKSPSTSRINNPRVQLDDLITEMYSVTTKLEKELSQLKEKIEKLESSSGLIDALKCLSVGQTEMTYDNAMTVGKIVNHVATEVHERIRRSKNAVVFNIADRAKLSVIGNSILKASGIGPVHCTFRRLKKLKATLSCPVLFQFSDEVTATRFIKSQISINQYPKLSHLRISRDLTPLQRLNKPSGRNLSPLPNLAHQAQTQKGVDPEFSLIELGPTTCDDDTPTISPQIVSQTNADQHLCTKCSSTDTQTLPNLGIETKENEIAGCTGPNNPRTSPAPDPEHVSAESQHHESPQTHRPTPIRSTSRTTPIVSPEQSRIAFKGLESRLARYRLKNLGSFLATDMHRIQ